ncbi:MAG: hypothetical protein GWN71_24280, partial [Gammaproteobacteria bacterium]|nr:hypothetical protein [Gemmatimonadota bacterium]NIU76566.1 hypothetical protein [Gammaproteobacteria bacterium]
MDEGFATRGALETDTLYVHDPGLLLSTGDVGHVSDLDRALASYGHALADAGGATISVAGVIEAIETDAVTLRTPAMVLRVDAEEVG